MRLVLCYPLEEKHLQQIKAVAPQLEIVNAGYERVMTEILDADLFCGHDRFQTVPWDEVVRRGRLRWIQSSAAGMDHCLKPSVIASDIQVCSASGALADQVAEQTFALLFGSARALPVFFRAQQKREFIRKPTRDVHGATVGIVGFGGNGRRLAEVLAPLRVRLLATDVFPEDKPASVAELWSHERLPDLLSQSDYVILAAPLNDDTRGMINRRSLAMMKPGAFLINVARGAMVIEPDLVEALQSGHLAGAGIDVTHTEPLPESSPLWSQPNLIITPHVGGQSARRLDDMTNLLCANLRRYLNGEPLYNYISDKRLGFPHPSTRPPSSVLRGE
ncbi:MAG: D-2-hydroxyacid dehydrogenase [Planctomycetaceae bacterium]|nr:D-2-hydroxyacid dehydrogenase [Planctomycetaceae bacterium]